VNANFILSYEKCIKNYTLTRFKVHFLILLKIKIFNDKPLWNWNFKLNDKWDEKTKVNIGLECCNCYFTYSRLFPLPSTPK